MFKQDSNKKYREDTPTSVTALSVGSFVSINNHHEFGNLQNRRMTRSTQDISEMSEMLEQLQVSSVINSTIHNRSNQDSCRNNLGYGQFFPIDYEAQKAVEKRKRGHSDDEGLSQPLKKKIG